MVNIKNYEMDGRPMNLDIYKKIYTKIFEPSCLIDHNMNIIDATISFLELFGYTSDDIMGEKLNLLFPRDAYDTIEKILLESDENLEWYADLPLEKKNGERFHENIGVFAVAGNEGRFVYCMAVQRLLYEEKINEFLEVSEERYKELVDSVNDIIFSLDIDGRFVTTGPYSVEPVRYKPDEVLIQALALNIKKEDIESKERTMDERPPHVEFKVMKRQGTVPVGRTLTRVGIKKEALFKIPEMSLDAVSGEITIDDRKTDPIGEKVEKSDEEQNATSIMSWIREGIIAFDNKGCLTDLNDAFLGMSGYSKEEVMGKIFEDLFLQDERENVRKMFDELLVKGTIIDYRANLQNKNGEILPVNLDATVIEDHDGENMGIVAVIRQETLEEKKVQNVLAEGMNISGLSIIKDPIQLLDAGIAVTDAGSNLIYANKALLSMIDKKEEDIFNKPFSHLVTESKREAINNNLEELRDRAFKEIINTELEGIDGMTVPVLLKICAIVDDDEKNIGNFIVINDEGKKVEPARDEKVPGETAEKEGEGERVKEKEGEGEGVKEKEIGRERSQEKEVEETVMNTSDISIKIDRDTDFLLEVDARGIIIRANHQALALLRYRGRALAGIPIGDVIFMEGESLSSDRLKDMFKKGPARRTVETTLFLSNIDPIPCIISIHHLPSSLIQGERYILTVNNIPKNITKGDRDFTFQGKQ